MNVTPKLPHTADVVIVGGGVMGVSIAYHLATAGVQNIVLLERDTLGSGSSEKPHGGVRASFSEPGNIILGQRSLDAYERFADDFGVDIGLNQVGYLFLCRTAAELAEAEASAAVQRSFGCDARVLSPAEAAELNPLLNVDALAGAVFTPRDGYARPAKVVEGYADAARALGVLILENTPVTHLEDEGGSVIVSTPAGSIMTQNIVIAAGAWSEALGAQLDVALPVTPVRRQIGFAAPLPLGDHPIPFTLDFSTTAYFHNTPDGLLIGISNRQDPGFDRDFDRSWVPEFDAAVADIAPSLVGVPLNDGWAGLYENTPDHNALIGRDSKHPHVFYATGFSGHGFLQAPAVGEYLTDLFLERETFLDEAIFSADRFASDRARVNELHII